MLTTLRQDWVTHWMPALADGLADINAVIAQLEAQVENIAF